MNDSSMYQDAIRQLIDGCNDLDYLTAVYSFAAAYPKQEMNNSFRQICLKQFIYTITRGRIVPQKK